MNKVDKKEQPGLGIPGLVQGLPSYDETLATEYTVKYLKANIDEPGEVMQLQALETKSMLGEEIILTDRQTNFFEGTFFVVIRYLEKRP